MSRELWFEHLWIRAKKLFLLMCRIDSGEYDEREHNIAEMN